MLLFLSYSECSANLISTSWTNSSKWLAKSCYQWNVFFVFLTSTVKIEPVQLFFTSSNYFVPGKTILFQCKLFCTSSNYFISVQTILCQFKLFCISSNYFIPVQAILYQFKLFYTSSNYFVPVQTIVYQFKLLCTSSSKNCSKVKIEVQHWCCAVFMMKCGELL